MSDTHTKRRSRRRAFLLALLVPLLFVGGAGWFTYARLRQEMLNRDLISAIRVRNAAAVHRLLVAGADANAVDQGNQGISVGHIWREFANRLLGRSTPKKPIQKDPYQKPAILVLLDWLSYLDALGTPLRSSGSRLPVENLDILKALLDHGAEVNVKDDDGRSPLFFAISGHYGVSARLLVERGADVNITTKDGDTPLFDAASWSDSRMVRLLLDLGADVNLTARVDGYTPLLAACWKQDAETIRCLVQHGADVNARDWIGDTPLMALTGKTNAQFSSRPFRFHIEPDLVPLLKQAGAKE